MHLVIQYQTQQYITMCHSTALVRQNRMCCQCVCVFTSVHILIYKCVFVCVLEGTVLQLREERERVSREKGNIAYRKSYCPLILHYIRTKLFGT